MILLPALLLAAAPPSAAGAASAPATAFLAAVAGHDLARARATLAADVQFMDRRRPDPGGATLESFATYVQGCSRTDLTWETDDADPTRSAVTATWACGGRGNVEAFVWTVGSRVVTVMFGPPRS